MGCYQTLIPYTCISIRNCNSELIFGMRVSLRILYKNISVSARPRHCGNPALHSEKAPRKMKEGPVKPFTFIRLHVGIVL